MTICLSVMAIALAYCLLCTRYYQSTSRIQIQSRASDTLSLDSIAGATPQASDAMESSLNMQTQAGILQSETLALKVIGDLDLEHTPEFKISGIPAKGTGVALEDDARRRAHALAIFKKQLTVSPLPGTKLLEVTYSDQNPQRAADVVNHLVQGLINFTIQSHTDSTSQTSSWLTSQLSDLRRQSELLQAKVVAMQKQTGIFATGETDAQGKGQSYSSTLDQLQQATTSLGQTEANLILKKAVNDVAKSGDPAALSSLGGPSIGNASPGVATSLALLQSLQTRQATTQEAIERARTLFGPNYPDLIELEASLKATRRSIATETALIAQRAKTDYDVAKLANDQTQLRFNAVRSSANALNDHNIDYIFTRQEAEQSRLLYEDLLRKLKEADILEGLRSSNITVLDRARLAPKPTKPQRSLIMLGSLAVGLILGCLLAFVREAGDDRIQSASDLAGMPHAPIMAVLPLFSQPKLGDGDPSAKVNVLHQPNGRYAEAVRVLRSAIDLEGLTRPLQVLSVSSALAGEGKSTLSLDLAILFAQQGRKVLFVEADMRGSVHQARFGSETEAGLSGMLADPSLPDQIHPFPRMLALDVLPAGTTLSNPADLLNSARMQQLLTYWRSTYEIILFDCPPILPVADSIVLSRMADFSILVVRVGQPRRQSVYRAIQMATSKQNSRVGLVLNGIDPKSDLYQEYYGYKANTSEVYS